MANATKLVFGKLPLLPPEEINIIVPGLTSVVGTVGDENFGDGGDIFDHLAWRSVFDLMASTVAGKMYLVGFGNMLMLRGHRFVREFKGKCVNFTFSLSRLTADELKSSVYFEGKTSITFPVNVPTETSKVQARALTPERLKCCLRPHIVSEMIRFKRLPALSVLNGYQKLVLTMQEIMVISDTLTAFLPMASSEEFKIKYESMYTRYEIDMWVKCITMAQNSGVMPYLNLPAAFAGSISSKEIYQYDETLIPGTVYWSGLHAMMTDVRNKYKADKVTSDLRARYEMSSFYDDFKRKMAARSIMIVNCKSYLNFLSAMSVLVPMYVLGKKLDVKHV